MKHVSCIVRQVSCFPPGRRPNRTNDVERPFDSRHRGHAEDDRGLRPLPISEEHIMKRALTLTTGLAIGYVAGARAGKERYAQIKQKAHDLSQQPAVADAAQSLREN